MALLTTDFQIQAYLESLPDRTRTDMQALYGCFLSWMPEARRWFLDGKNADGKVVSNPNIGFGLCTLPSGKENLRDFYRIGLCARQSGISVYFMGLPDKEWLKNRLTETIGKATVTGYCLQFRHLADIRLDVLEEVVRLRMALRS